MKFTLEIGKKGLRIRREILDASGFAREEALSVRGEENVVVILKQRMTAMELVQVIQSLKDQTSDLLVHLAKLCGSCRHCENECPYLKESSRVRLPDNMLEQAGIPKGARLDALIGEGEVLISQAEWLDLRDVSPEMKELFRQTHICLDSLDELLAGGGIVYES